MVIFNEAECPTCRGEGWVADPTLGTGLDPVTCPTCDGTGCIPLDLNSEVEDWMEDE